MSIQQSMRKVVQFALILMLAIGVSACAKRGKHGGVGEDDIIGVGDPIRFYGTDVSPEQEREWLAKNTYHFGYDRFDISEDDTMSIYAHAKKLILRPNSRVRIEGHTDERGSREYNIALSERRAKAVANIMMLKGVGQHQISIVSYGKEKPAAHGHDESSWSQNRRAVVIYEVEK